MLEHHIFAFRDAGIKVGKNSGLVVKCKCCCGLQAGAVELLQSVMDTGVQNVATDRVDYILTWLKVGADQDDFRAPGGDKTFEGLFTMAGNSTNRTQF